MNRCEIRFHSDERINDIIKELTYGNQADAYRLAKLIREPAFNDYWHNDSVGQKYDNLTDIPKPTLRGLIREYRNANTFSVKNNTKLNTNSGYYAFKSKEAFNTGKNFIGDTVYKFWTEKLNDNQRNIKGAVAGVKGRIKKDIKRELVKRLNKYNTDNNFSVDTSIQELINYAYNTEEVSEVDRNFADLVYTAYSSTAFWQEAFQNAKVVNLGLKLTDEDAADKESMTEDAEDAFIDDEQSDNLDESTKGWDVDKTYGNFGKHVSEENRARFNNLVRLSSPVYNSSGSTFNEKYQVDRNNPLGVPTYHSYQEVMIELSDINANGGWKSVDDFIDGVERIANKKKDFYGLIVLVNQMRANKDLAYAIYKDVDKYNVDVMEIDINEDSIESVQSNTRNTSARQIYYGLRNSIKTTAQQLDNVSLENDIKEIDKLIKRYKNDLNAGGNRTIKAGGRTIVVNVDAQLNDITTRIKDIYKSYFPNLDTTAIDRYIINYKNSPDILSKLNANISAIVNGAIKTAEEKRKRDYIIARVNSRNWKKREEAIQAGQDPNSLTYEDIPTYDEDYIVSLDAPLSNFVRAIAPYTSSKAELNYRNINNNLQSGLIYNNYITNITKSLSDPQTLNLWVEEKLRNPKEYKYSSILFDDPEHGIKGIVGKNGKLTPYAPYLIHTYLLNGIRNNTTNMAKDYTNMSDADYFLTGYYAFKRNMRNYRKYDTGNTDVPAVAPYLMRTPSDAPKNFAVTLPKYNLSDLYEWDTKAIEKLTDQLASPIINKDFNYYTINKNLLNLQAVIDNVHINMSREELADFVVNVPESYELTTNKIVEKEGNKVVFAVISTDQDGAGIVWFRGDSNVAKNGKINVTNIEYLGIQRDGIKGLYAQYFWAVKRAVENRIKANNPQYRSVNHNSAIYNILRNAVLGEISEYYEAEDYVKNHSKEEQIEFYHYGKKGAKGNVFRITKLDNDVYNIGETIENWLSPSTGERPFVYNSDGSIGFVNDTARDNFNNLIDEWINRYENYVVNFVHNNYGNFIEQETNADIAEYMFNAYIANMAFDDLFEGNAKYYKDPQTFLKRAKEVQASGTSFASNFNSKDYQTNPFIQGVNNTGEAITVGGRTVNIRTGWNAITIKNVNKASDNYDIIYKSLLNAGLSKRQAAQLAGPFGYDSSQDSELDGMTWADTTMIDDAQSYITIYEAARRIKLMGEYSRYEKLLNQLTDDTTKLEDINPNELTSFIQIFKNFYYDQYYDNNIGRHVSRQIKNAEFVLVPKFLGEDTSLGRLARIMIENDIDQVNTQETSKATNYEVIEYWDEKTGKATTDLNGFAERAKQVKKPFSYMYLYRQQEVPQHLVDEQNKAGIQIMKKVLDNLFNASPAVRTAADNLKFAYAANIKESFDELMNKYGIEFDSKGNIISNNENNKINFAKVYKLAQEQAARLGSDSNLMDYVTIRNDNTGIPVMPNIFNINSNKIESIAQSQFNRNVTRQKLPGWHAAQTTGLGLEGKIPQIGNTEASEKLGTRVQLAYHKDRNIFEILLPKWASNMFNQYDENGNLIKEVKIEDVDDKVLNAIGYRIPTEGKQSIAVLKVVGFLPEWMGSTVVVPDEWVTQTGSDFDVDSIYGIAYETYIGKDGRIHAIEYLADNDEISNWARYANYVNRNVNKTIRKENAVYLTDEEKAAEKERIKRIVESDSKEQDTFYERIREVLNTDESEYYSQLSNKLKEELNPIFKNKNLKFKDRVSQIIAKLVDIQMEGRATDATEELLEVYRNISNIIQEQIEFNTDNNQRVYEMMKGVYANYYKEAIKRRAKAAGNLMSFEEFIAQPIELQNSRQARNNRILDSMIEIMNSKDATAENLARSNFDDITSANKIIDDMFGTNKNKVNVYNPFTQIRFRRNAMSGAMLKAFSVTRDTADSVFNVSRAKLETPIAVKYSFNDNNAYGAREEYIKQAYGNNYDKNTHIVIHDGLANSINDRNVAGELITVASSHTTAHILDAIKEGAIENENEYTFAAFKTLFDVGVDAYSAILWIRQPGVSRIVNAYYDAQSVFARGQFNPINTAIKRLARELGVKINNNVVGEYDTITDVMAALKVQFGERFKELTGGEIDFNYKDNKISIIDVPQMEQRVVDNNMSEEDKLLLDLKAILNFDYINNIASTIQQHARVMNPDRFGAKQTVFETRQVFNNINTLYDKGIANKIYTNYDAINKKYGAKRTLLEAIYPGLITNDIVNFRNFLSADRTRESVYPSVYSFLRYSTIPSIIINSNLFETESNSFVTAITSIENFIKGKVNKELYNTFKSYVLDAGYKEYSEFISLPISLDRYGNIITNENSYERPEDIAFAREYETRRIYGYGYPSIVDIDIANINKPTKEEIDAFVKLTPAQKIMWIQNHLNPSERTIFDNIEANLYDTRNIRKTGAVRQSIQFNDQDQNRERLYDMFDEAFFNNNPLIRLTAMDVIKYAFIVEGYRFTRRSVGKLIKNTALYTEIENGGTDLVNSLRGMVNEITYDNLISNNVYEDFVRSHSTIPQIPTYRIKYKKNSPDIYPLTNTSGMYYFNLNTAKDTAKATEIGIIKEDKVDGKTIYNIATSYINIVGRKNKTTLYKIVKLTNGSGINEIYLYPLNKLEPFEHGKFSINDNNNVNPSIEYYQALLNERLSTNSTFAELVSTGNNLFTKETANQFKADKNTNTKRNPVPNDINYISSMAEEDGAVRQMINTINETLVNTDNNYCWVWCGSTALRRAFATTNVASEQMIVDNDGNINTYIVKRINMRNIDTKKVIDPLRQKAIVNAQANGVKNLDTIYVIKKKITNDNATYKRAVEEEHQSSLDIDDSFGTEANPTNVTISQSGALAQEFIIDLRSRSKFKGDDFAKSSLDEIAKTGVIPSLASTIEEHKVDTIKTASTYYSSIANQLVKRIDNFISTEDGDILDITDERLIDEFKKNKQLLKDYMDFVLSASTFGDRFRLIDQISEDNLDNNTKNNLRVIRDAIARIRTNPKLRQAMNLIADKVYGIESTNPIILENLSGVSDYLSKDAGFFDKHFQDAQEISIPIVQLVLRHANSRVHELNFIGRDQVRDYNKFIKDVKERAKAAGFDINWDNIINNETGRWRTNFDESFYNDKNELLDARSKAQKQFGLNSKEYLLANRTYEEWLYNNTEQEYVDTYYKEILDNEAPMLNPNFIDYFVTYKQLNEELHSLLNVNKNNRTVEANNRIKAIKNIIANMRSEVDYNTGEEKPELEFMRAKRLDAYIKGSQDIAKKYFNREARTNFDKDLKKYLDIVDSYRKYDSNGNPLFTEENLLRNTEYAFAIEWLEDNAVYDYNDEIRNQINDAFTKLSSGKNKYRQFKSIVAATNNAYDSNGTIVGTTFNESQIAAIKKEQEQIYNTQTTDGDSGLVKLIRNRQPDEEAYSSAFYDKFRTDLNNPPSEDRKSWIRKANSILVDAVDNNTGKIYLSRLTVDQLRALNTCYEALGNIHDTTNKPDSVKQFIENEVEFATDEKQWLLDKDAAEQKGKEYYNVWKTVANAKVFNKGKFIGYESSPNSQVYGYVRPKAAVRDLYIDKERTEALKFIREHVTQVPTRYYWEARQKAINDGKLKEFEEANHVYNPYSGKKEPLRIWLQTEVRELDGAYRQWKPNYANTRGKIKDFARNDKYKKYSSNYKDNGNKYKVKDVANEYEKELRSYLMDLMYNLSKDNYTASKFVSRGLIPRRRVVTNSTANTIRALGNFIGVAPTVDIERGISRNIGYAYDRNHNLPMLDTLKDASYKEHIRIREQKIDESNEDYAKYTDAVRKQNREIDDYNRKLDASLMDKDYESVFKEFIIRAVDANAKAEVRNDLYYLIDYLEKYYETVYTTTFGNISKDKSLSTDDRIVYRKKKAENALAMVKTFTGRLLFDEYKPFTKYDRLASVLQNIASAKYMMFNITGGIGNVLTGATNIFMETFAGDYVDWNDWREAQGYYLKGFSSYILNMGSEKSNNLPDAIIKMMSIIDYAGVTEVGRTADATNIPGAINKMKNAAYFPQTSGEHYMQNTMMFAMMNSHRIVNGQIMNFNDFTRDRENKAMKHVLENHPDIKEMFDRYVKRIKVNQNSLKNYIWFKHSIYTDFLRAINNKDISKEYIEARKTILKEARKDFENYAKLIDQFELSEDGYADLKKDTEINYAELAKFKGRVVSVNKKIHGIYDKLGGARIESTLAFGSIIMQYHKHIYNGFMKRFRINGYYNESRQSREIGSYVSVWNFATTEFKGIRERIAENKDSDGVGVVTVALQEVCKSAINTFLNYKLNWNTLDISEQNNIKRNLGELISIAFTLLGAIAANCLLLGIDDDDDPILSFIGNTALYQMDKLSSETIMYINFYPELKKTWSNPVAIGSSFNDLFSSLGICIKYLTEGDEFNPNYETGQYAGENKLKVYLTRQIPIYRSIQRLSTLDENNSYYKLGKNMLGVIPVEDIAKFIMDKD